MTILDALPEVPYLSPFDLYAHLGLVRVMEPHTEILMRERAERERIGGDYGPHARPWFVSFHGSMFPGEPLDACQRRLLYTMMDFAEAEAVPPWVTATGVLGKAGELDLADAWFRGGRMLAVPEDHDILDSDTPVHQLGFVDNSLWFTVSTDLPILPPGWTRPHIVEVKGKADEVVEEMLQGRILQFPDGRQERRGRGPDPAHVNQLKATIGEAHEYDWGSVTVCRHTWRILRSDIHERLGLPGGVVWGKSFSPEGPTFVCPDHHTECLHTFKLERPTSGEIYYWSRSWPRKTKSFYYEYDPAFMDRGRAVLAEVRQHFIDDTVPDRPEHFQWSVGPCANCPFKPLICRPDAGVPGRKKKPDPDIVRTRLSESHGVDYTAGLREGYDSQAVRARVFAEWADPMAGEDR